jgi:hypothetical protein
MQSFRDIIALWPSPEALADEIGEKGWTVRKWKQRDSIPSGRWLAVIEAAAARGARVTAEEMARIAAREAAQ